MERACLLGAVKCHQITSDENECMRGDALAAALADDKAKGLIPFYVSVLNSYRLIVNLLPLQSFLLLYRFKPLSVLYYMV